jgi:hypothetical protein
MPTLKADHHRARQLPCPAETTPNVFVQFALGDRVSDVKGERQSAVQRLHRPGGHPRGRGPVRAPMPGQPRHKHIAWGAMNTMGMATWPATVHELTQLQQALGEMTPECWQPPTTLGRIGACFVCFERVQGAGAAGDRGLAGAAVTHRRQLLAGVTVSGPAGGPYRPTMLSLREGPLLEQAVRALPITPEVLVGQCHRTRPSPPRRPCLSPWRRPWAGGRPCRLADRRPGRGPGGAGCDPSCSDPTAAAPRPYSGPNPAGAHALNAATCVSACCSRPDYGVLLARWQGMRRLRRLPRRPDIKVTARGWSLLWLGMVHSLSHLPVTSQQGEV